MLCCLHMLLYIPSGSLLIAQDIHHHLLHAFQVTQLGAL